MFATKLQSTSDRKNFITNEIAAILMSMTRRVLASFQKILETCVAGGGEHLRDNIFHK